MKKYLIVLIVVALIIIGAGVVYWKLAKSTSTNPEQACTEEAKICPDGSAVGRQGPGCEFAECPVAQAVDETADWKTYTNKVLGLEFDYPKEWFVREEETKYNKRIYIENMKGGENYNLSNYPKDFAMLYIDYWGPVYDNRMTYDQITKEKSSFSVPKITINTNLIPIDIYESNFVPGQESPGPKIEAYWQYKGMTYSAYTKVDVELKQKQIEVEILKKMLSTFKFTK